MLLETTFRLDEAMKTIPAGTMPDLRRVNIANGKQARVVRIADYPNAERPCVAKFCGGEHKGYTFDEAQMLIEATKRYRAELERAGVPIPINHRIQPVQVEADNSWQIIMVDEMHGDGEDIKAKLLNGYTPDHKRWLMLKILEFLNELPDGERQNDLITCPTAVLGDFKPDNWVVDHDKAFLIDYFAPKSWGEDGLLTPFLPKVDALLTRGAITFLCGDRRGQFSRIMAMAKMTYPDLFEFTVETGLAMLAKDHPEAHGWVKDEYEHGFDRINQMYQMRPTMLGGDAV